MVSVVVEKIQFKVILLMMSFVVLARLCFVHKSNGLLLSISGTGTSLNRKIFGVK